MKNSIADIHPELAKQWSERNYPVKPFDVSYGSNKLYWWKGACGHEWQTSPKARSSGENCPVCSNRRIISGINDLATLKPQIMTEWSPKNELDPKKLSVGTNQKVLWVCEKGHEWIASVKSRTTNETGCPYCSHNAVLPGFNDLASLFPMLAKEWSDKNYPLMPNRVTAFANKKVWWKCNLGHEWETLISTRSYGSGCPYCSGLKTLKGFNDLATTHSLLAEEWSPKNYPLTANDFNSKSTANVWWRCKKCGFEWKSVIRARAHKGISCPACADRVVVPGKNDLCTTDPIVVQEWNYDKNKHVSPQAVSRSSLRSVWWKCRLITLSTCFGDSKDIRIVVIGVEQIR